MRFRMPQRIRRAAPQCECAMMFGSARVIRQRRFAAVPIAISSLLTPSIIFDSSFDIIADATIRVRRFLMLPLPPLFSLSMLRCHYARSVRVQRKETNDDCACARQCARDAARCVPMLLIAADAYLR